MTDALMETDEGFRNSTQLLITRGPLLNFWTSPIWLPHPHRIGELCQYRTVEHRFQAMKSLVCGHVAISGHDTVNSQVRPSDAKREGRMLPIDVALWNRISEGIMLEAVLAKFTQHEDLREALLLTDPYVLFEHRPDPVWGDNMDGTGQNKMGLILERVRAALL